MCALVLLLVNMYRKGNTIFVDSGPVCGEFSAENNWSDVCENVRRPKKCFIIIAVGFFCPKTRKKGFWKFKKIRILLSKIRKNQDSAEWRKIRHPGGSFSASKAKIECEGNSTGCVREKSFLSSPMQTNRMSFTCYLGGKECLSGKTSILGTKWKLRGMQTMMFWVILAAQSENYLSFSTLYTDFPESSIFLENRIDLGQRRSFLDSAINLPRNKL